MHVWDPLQQGEMSLQYAWRRSCTVQCTSIGGNSDDWAVVSVIAIYGASAAAYAGNIRLSM